MINEKNDLGHDRPHPRRHRREGLDDTSLLHRKECRKEEDGDYSLLVVEEDHLYHRVLFLPPKRIHQRAHLLSHGPDPHVPYLPAVHFWFCTEVLCHPPACSLYKAQNREKKEKVAEPVNNHGQIWHAESGEEKTF